MKPKRSRWTLESEKNASEGTTKKEEKKTSKLVAPNRPLALNPRAPFGTDAPSPPNLLSICPCGLRSTSITLEACFPSSASLPPFPEHLSLHTSLSFSLQEAAINSNHAGSVLSVIRRACACTSLTACRGSACAAEPCTHSCTSTCTFSVL